LSSKDENSTHQNRTQNQTVNNEVTTTNSSKSTNPKTAEKSYREAGNKMKLTSQQLESAQQSAQKTPEYNTGNVDSKHARPAARHNTAGQPTPEPQL
jgi:hypothetical protein